MDKIFSPIKGRIIQFLENIGVSKESFFEKTGISASNFKGKGAFSEIGGDKIVKILTYYPELNPEWLIIGRGEILLYPRDTEAVVINKAQKFKTDRKTAKQMIPLYDIADTAGSFELLVDSANKKHTPIDYISIPGLPKCDGALPIIGDSMYPLLKSGDIALYKEVQDLSNIIWGEMYLVALSHNGDDFFFAKYLQKSEQDGYIKLVSHNHSHQSKDFPLSSIRALALIKATVRINTQF